MPTRTILILFFLALCFVNLAQVPAQREVVKPHVSPALRFTENNGQWDDFILFKAQMSGGALFVEKNAITFSFHDQNKYAAMHHGGILKKKFDNLDIPCHAYKVHFENCKPIQSAEKLQQGSDYENFYLGNDRSKWKSNVHNYHQIFLRELYTGIDYELLTATNGLKYNFHVKPGANVQDIKMRYEGVDKMYLKDGALFVKLQVNSVVEQRPYAYQLINGQVKIVKCNYVLRKNILGFSFPDGYDANYDLVIDPVLVFAASSGSSANNFGMTATFDPQGNLYSGGTVFSNGYPVTLGAFSLSFSGNTGNGITDIAITKYNSSGNNLLYSTYVGGSQAEVISSMIVDQSNNLCFYGATGSPDFPVTTGAYDVTFNGGTFLGWFSNGTIFNFGTDIYVGKLNANGSALLGCTFLGGNGNDGVNHVNVLSNIGTPQNPVLEFFYDSLQFNYGDQYRGEIQVDLQNNIYIASSTRSSNFPTVNAFDNTLGGRQDAIVAKFNSSLSQLLYSTFLGGSFNDCANSLIVNNNLEVYVTGGTCSSNFPTTFGAFDVAYNGGIADGFITRINASGNGILQSTFLGTNNYDQPYFIQTDKYNQIYVYGQSLGNMPVITATNAVTIFNVPGTHQFISRFNSTLSTLNMSTVFGNFTNNVDISPCAFSVDKCLNIYISGWGGNLLGGPPLANMPLLQPTQATTTGFDFYFMGLDSNAAALSYGSYFGGAISQEHVDGGTSRFDPSGKIYQSACAGCQNNDDWPVTPGAWPLSPGNPNFSSGCNNGVVKLDFQLQMAIATIQTATLGGCAPFTASLNYAGSIGGPGSTFIWYLAPGQTTTTNLNPTVTFTAPGIYTVSLVVRDNLTCNKKDSAVTYITVYPKPTANINLSTSTCTNVITVSNNSTGNLGSNPHFWNFGGLATSTLSGLTFTFPANGIFNISYTVTDVNGCKDVRTNTVNIFDFLPTVVSSSSICAGQSTTISAGGGTSYTWTPGATLNNSLISTPVASPPGTTNYSVTILNNSSGFNCTRVLVAQVIVLPIPNTNFGLNSSPCSNTITTSNTSSGNLGSNPYEWNFGDGSSTVTGSTPFYTYPGNGTFTVTLTVTDVNGCKSSLTRTVAIFNFTPGVVSSSTLCYGLTTSLLAEGGTNYTWTPATSLSNTLIPNPSANPTVTTVYTVQIYNDTPGYTCSRTLTTQILVRPTPTTNFDFIINPCGGGVNFVDQSQEDIAAWSWTLSPTRTATVQFPYNFYNVGGNFTVTLLTTNIYGCTNLLEKPLGVPIPPPLTVSSETNICIGDSAQLFAEGGLTYDWTPPETLDFPTLYNPIATPTITTEYSVNITTSIVVNGNTCDFLLTSLVNVDVLSTTPIKATANPVLITTGDPTTLTYIGDPGALVIWLPQGSTSPNIGYTVIAYPQKPTTYTAVASRGVCLEEVEVHVDAFTAGCTVKDFFVPNTFTPNGDGENDVLYVRGLKVDEVYFTVYNRWGEKVFETNDKNIGWNGRYKGKDADIGVFGWYLTVKCVNGKETFSKGNVTLIR